MKLPGQSCVGVLLLKPIIIPQRHAKLSQSSSESRGEVIQLRAGSRVSKRGDV